MNDFTREDPSFQAQVAKLHAFFATCKLIPWWPHQTVSTFLEWAQENSPRSAGTCCVDWEGGNELRPPFDVDRVAKSIICGLGLTHKKASTLEEEFKASHKYDAHVTRLGVLTDRIMKAFEEEFMSNPQVLKLANGIVSETKAFVEQGLVLTHNKAIHRRLKLPGPLKDALMDGMSVEEIAALAQDVKDGLPSARPTLKELLDKLADSIKTKEG